MRVALIHHQLGIKGGMETYLHSLIQGFHEQRDATTAFVYKNNHDSAGLSCNVHVNSLAFLPRAWRKLFFGWRAYKIPALQSLDCRISLMRAIKQDFIVCGGTHIGYLKHANKRASLLDKLEIKLERESYHTAKAIIAHSKLLEEELINFYEVPKEKIVTLLPPINPVIFHQHYRSEKTALRMKYGIDLDKIAIFFPSTGHKRKGFDLLLQTLRTLPPNKFQLIIAGNKPKKSSIDCHYVGFINNMTEVYSACDMTVLPSVYEPFGLVVLESLQCGSPVIISKFVGAKDLVSNNEGFVLEELSVDSLRAAIMELGEKKLVIPPDFAEKKQLTLDAHINSLKEVFGRML